MPIKITFLGAVQNVTGSQYLIEVNNLRFLVDCGLYQERQLIDRNWRDFPYPPSSLETVLLTHAHLDHCGLLPKLVRDGFKRSIQCTRATSEIAQITLLDSANIMQEDAEQKRRRHEREKRKGPYPELPLYSTKDAENVFPLLGNLNYQESVAVGDGVTATFFNSGHVLGSSMIFITVKQNGEERTILFSGDIGRPGKPIIQDPAIIEQADYVLVEATYGDKALDTENIDGKLADIVNTTMQAGGNLIIPSFALERAQDLLYYLNLLLMQNRIPPVTVFVDSPLAVSITQVFKRHPEMLDEEMRALLRDKKSPFDFPGLKLVRTIDESKAINDRKEPAIIISGSGMVTGGRIKHHLIHNISRPECTVLFVGYQAEGTLGRQIVEGTPEVRILGQKYPVRARIAQIHGFSGHADRDQLLKWLAGFRKPPRRIFVTHSEPATAQSFAGLVHEKMGWDTVVPEYKETVILS